MHGTGQELTGETIVVADADWINEGRNWIGTTVSKGDGRGERIRTSAYPY
jgi:hypothetical protein